MDTKVVFAQHQMLTIQTDSDAWNQMGKTGKTDIRTISDVEKKEIGVQRWRRNQMCKCKYEKTTRSAAGVRGIKK